MVSDSGETSSWRDFVVDKGMNLLLIAFPVAFFLEYTHASGVAIFVAAGIAIIPLAGLMGRATENLSETVGPGLGGLLNATLGNAAELIIALFAIAKGPQMYPLVKASITGSIVGNILLILGLSALVGGLRFETQKFNAQAASVGATLLGLAAIGLVVPAIFFGIVQSEGGGQRTEMVVTLSEEISFILALAYVFSLIFSLRTHKHLYAGDPTSSAEHTPHAPEWSVRTSLIVLVLATIGVAFMAEMLVGAVEPAAHAFGMNSVFIGVIVVAIVGNAAEHSTAVLVAYKNKMDLAMNIAIGSGIQVALLVAPVLVFASLLMGHDQVLDLHFSALEVFSVVAAVIILSMISTDGETNWMEGILLLAVYIILGLAFYNLPETLSSSATPAAGH